MMSSPKRLAIRFLLVSLAALSHLAAAPAKTWESLSQLSAGTPIEVVTAGNDEKGAFVSLSTESLIIRTDRGEQRFLRADVVRIVSRSHPRRVRNALIGVAAGIAISLITDRTAGTYLRNESNPTIARPLIWTLPIAIGGGIGAAFPSYRVIYRK